MADIITIAGLPAVATPTVDHVVPAMKDGVTVFLSVSQIVTLVQSVILDGAPGALDTLNELAGALGDDANYASTTAAALALRVRVDAAQSLTAGQKTQGRENIGAVGNIHKRTVITLSGAHVFHSESTFALIELQGGGGGGGDSGTAASTAASAGGGGGEGGRVEKLITLSGVISATVTIGAGGSGTASGPGPTAGGTSSYADGTHTLTANGGSPGLSGSSSTAAVSRPGGAGGSATGGDINLPGNAGEPGFSMGSDCFSITFFSAIGGRGASGRCGQSGTGGVSAGALTAAANGANAAGYGAGGGGGIALNGIGPVDGGAGSQGVCIITEYK